MSELKSIIHPNGMVIKEGDKLRISNGDWSQDVIIVYKYETLGFMDKTDKVVFPIHWHFETSKIEKI